MAQLTRMCSLTSKSRRTTGNLGYPSPEDGGHKANRPALARVRRARVTENPWPLLSGRDVEREGGKSMRTRRAMLGRVWAAALLCVAPSAVHAGTKFQTTLVPNVAGANGGFSAKGSSVKLDG